MTFLAAQNVPIFTYAGVLATLIPTEALTPGMKVILAEVDNATGEPVIRTVKSVTVTPRTSGIAGVPLYEVDWGDGTGDTWPNSMVAQGLYLWTVMV